MDLGSTPLGSSLSALTCEFCLNHIGVTLILGSNHVPQSWTMKRCRGRPAGLGFTPFRLIFVHVAPGFKYSPKLLELVNVSENYNYIVLEA